MRHRVQKSSAFTLIELLAVIIIVGIVAALVVMAGKGARQNADIEAAKAGITFIESKINAYVAKRGQLPPDLPDVDDVDGDGDITEFDGDTTEVEIYQTLAAWDFAVPPQKQVDPWGNPYVIVFQRDYDPNGSFAIDRSLAPYNAAPWDRLKLMYIPTPAAPGPKDIHEGDPATTAAYLTETNAFQIISAGPDGLVSRDDRERTADQDGDGKSVNADNLTNW